MRRTHTYHTKLFATIAAGALTISLAACSNDSEEETTATSAAESATSEAQDDGQWPRTITTLNGNGEETEVTIESKPENIVSTSVTLTGGLLAIDAPVKATGTVNNRAPLANQDGFFTRWADEAESKGVKSIYVGEPNVEAVLAEAPDLVIISSAGQDSAIDLYDQLADTVPTVVIDYSKQSWEETAEQLGEATGNEKGAEDAIKRYEDRVEEVKNAINAPEQPVNIVSLAQEGGGLNFWTKDSAQGRILSDHGFEVAQPDESLVDTSSNFAKRKDT